MPKRKPEPLGVMDMDDFDRGYRVPDDPLKPDLTLLCKLGSVLVHTEELLSPKGHVLDKEALNSLLKDPQVKEWVKNMGVYLPVKR